MIQFRRSFNGRFLLAIVALHTILVPILLIGVYLVAKPGVQGQFVNQARSDALVLANLTESRLASGKTNDIESLMDELLLHGRLVFAELIDGDRVIRPRVPLSTRSKFDEDFFFGQHSDNIYFISVPLGDGAGDQPPVLRLGYDETSAQNELLLINRRSLYLVGAYLGLTLLVGALLGRRLVRPLTALRLEADQISSGDSSQAFNTHSGISEVAALATNLEAMRQTIVHARDAALQAALAKSEFLANMSHEIRTPMNGVIGMLELAMRTELTPLQREYLAMAASSAESLLRLLNDILDFSKIEARKLELESVCFDLRDTVGDTLKLLAPQAHAKDLELTYLIAPDLPDIVCGDAGRIRQVLINLVSNAIKFTSHGEIIVRVKAGCDRCTDEVCPEFSVSDTGIGIPEEKQGLIFDAFSQADASATRLFGGTGLGLSISSRLINLMGGRIWLESELGKGSTFYFTIPLQISPESSEGLKCRPVDLRGIKALIVDDLAINRFIYMEMLSQWGMEPTQADCGETALKEIRRAEVSGAPFRLVLLDAMMPGMNGFDLAAQIHANPSAAAPTIMLISSADRAGDFELSCRLGISRYLRKPVKYSELLGAIQEVLYESSAAPKKEAVNPDSALRPLVSKLNVLVAEDNPVNQTLVQTLLENRGHQVTVVSNGEEALTQYESGTYDLILMDVQMPIMDGLQATVTIREREQGQGRHIYIVAMTAHALQGDRERCLDAGMDSYISKPLREPELLAAVERWSEMSDSVNSGGEIAMEEAQPFNLQDALARVSGRRELLKSLAEIVIAQSKSLYGDCETAIRNRDASALEIAAHTLKSSASSLAASATAELAQRLENSGRTGDFDTAEALLAPLREALDRLTPALREFLNAP